MNHACELNGCVIESGVSEQFARWNVSPRDVGELAVLASQYVYNDPVGQARELINQGILTSEDPAGRPVVIMPNFAEKTGPRRTGQCSEIASKLMVATQTGWLDRINDVNMRSGKPALDVTWVLGRVPGHFSDHSWVDIRPEDGPDNEAVVADGSFKRIAVAGDAYVPVLLRRRLEDIPMDSHEILDVAEPGRPLPDDPRVFASYTTLLSMTSDYSLGIDIGFRPGSVERLRPVLDAYDDSGTSISRCYHDENGALHWDDPDAIVDAAHRDEVEEVFTLFEQAPVSHDSTAYERFAEVVPS